MMPPCISQPHRDVLLTWLRHHGFDPECIPAGDLTITAIEGGALIRWREYVFRSSEQRRRTPVAARYLRTDWMGTSVLDEPPFEVVGGWMVTSPRAKVVRREAMWGES